ncbi:MAG: glycoside-pentoside-hexuronide (GPH):cation symporter [Blautia producta]|nr:glycoside-pentoside-hexuronide (GPH):cation symporter [Blautia producta]MDU5221135.1 glycoside-pentoside-hexuronide (GPH):cation symporter [Blautia producta]MDU5382512.1 glycoside-pentoside-hexuronide (GPH):cation symporter [Blautia producta]MDU6884056.1 glycoside-pentoside-hexuronide (GPH):cation symporter [Blautia producta]
MNENNKVRPFGMRDKIGYMFGDFGNDFTFIFASSFLMVFYTKVLGISGAMVGTLFLLARVVDAFTDITMGRIVDSVKPARDGRFRCWVRRMCGPVAIASFLMYQSAMAGAPMALKVVYMYVTYLLWGSVFYTSINIPYGSMASAITDKPDERTALSTFRTVGATLAGLIIGTVTPLLIYTKDADGNQIVRGGSTFTIIAGVFALCAVLCYVICYKLTTERVKVEPDTDAKKVTLGQTFTAIFRSRALLGIIGAAIFLLLSQLLIQAMNNYLYTEYFGSAGAISIMTILNTVLMLVVVAPLSVPISRRFGKKEASTVGALLAGTVFLLLFFLKVKNVAVYIVLANIGMLGLGFFNTVIWANITDVIDDQEVKTGQREDGTVYAVYSFARKLGQALAGGAGGWALSIIGYDQLAKVQTEAVINGLYTTSTLIPAVCFFIVALFLWFIYPLGKKNVEANVEELKRRRENA